MSISCTACNVCFHDAQLTIASVYVIMGARRTERTSVLAGAEGGKTNDYNEHVSSVDACALRHNILMTMRTGDGDDATAKTAMKHVRNDAGNFGHKEKTDDVVVAAAAVAADRSTLVARIRCGRILWTCAGPGRSTKTVVHACTQFILFCVHVVV